MWNLRATKKKLVTHSHPAETVSVGYEKTPLPDHITRRGKIAKYNRQTPQSIESVRFPFGILEIRSALPLTENQQIPNHICICPDVQSPEVKFTFVFFRLLMLHFSALCGPNEQKFGTLLTWSQVPQNFWQICPQTANFLKQKNTNLNLTAGLWTQRTKLALLIIECWAC